MRSRRAKSVASFRGLTLIELLVIIAVVCALSAIFFPPFVGPYVP